MMDYKAEIIIKEDPENICRCLIPERISRERSSLKIKKGKDSLSVHIEAKDAVAFRATINALMQVIAVYSKTKGIK